MLTLKGIAWGLPGGEEIIKDVSFTASTGRLVVVTGPNGGGKTSLAKLIAGLETPSAGQILLDGEDITPLDVTARAKRGVGYAFQQPVRFKGLTVRDLLELASGHPMDEAALCTVLPFITSSTISTRLLGCSALLGIAMVWMVLLLPLT